MSSYDRQFEVVKPGLDALIREPLTVTSLGLIDPTGTSPVPLIDGELVQHTTTRKWDRASDATAPSFFVCDERGMTDVRVSRKLTAILGGPSFSVRTIVYDTALTTLYAKVGQGTVSNSLSGSVSRKGLVAASTNWVLGVIIGLPAVVGNNKLEVFITGL